MPRPPLGGFRAVVASRSALAAWPSARAWPLGAGTGTFRAAAGDGAFAVSRSRATASLPLRAPCRPRAGAALLTVGAALWHPLGGGRGRGSISPWARRRRPRLLLGNVHGLQAGATLRPLGPAPAGGTVSGWPADLAPAHWLRRSCHWGGGGMLALSPSLRARGEASARPVGLAPAHWLPRRRSRLWGGEALLAPSPSLWGEGTVRRFGPLALARGGGRLLVPSASPPLTGCPVRATGEGRPCSPSRPRSGGRGLFVASVLSPSLLREYSHLTLRLKKLTCFPLNFLNRSGR